MNEGNEYSSALFITLARDAQERCDDGWTEHAVTSIVTAYMAAEAFVNEVAGVSAVLAKQDKMILQWEEVKSGSAPITMTSDELTQLVEYVSGRHRDADPPSTRALCAALNGKKSVPTVKRYDLILATLGAPAGFEEREPRQALWRLSQVRNYLVHRKSDETLHEMEGGGLVEGGWDLGMVVVRHPVPPFAEYLMMQKLVPEGTYPGPMSKAFLHLLCRKTIAAWACGVVAAAVREVQRLLPEGELRRDLSRYSLLGSSNLDGLLSIQR